MQLLLMYWQLPFKDQIMLAFACSRCHTPLEQVTEDQFFCPADRLVFPRFGGIWRMLLPERQVEYRQFIHEYETVRQAEGRGSTSPAFYRSLPYHDLSGRRPADWRIRAASFDAFLSRVLRPIEKKVLRILDLGAGNGWLSNRLAERGHQVAAVDLTTNDFDGLACCRCYETAFLPVQAEFDHLPFPQCSIDLVLFNASLHYATCYERALQEALRVLDAGGRVVILDTPFYRNLTSGKKMVAEREQQFTQQYGFPSDALASENYLTYARLEELTQKLNLDCQILTPFYGLGWALRPWKARLLGQREPAKFHLVILQANPLPAKGLLANERGPSQAEVRC